jgi:Na+-driven multidrug efflux pump
MAEARRAAPGANPAGGTNPAGGSNPSGSVNPLGADNIGALLLRFSIPAIISMLVNALYNIVDQIFIGQGIGFLGIAATNVSFPLTTASTAAALLFGLGGAANFNLYLGRGHHHIASYIVGNSASLLALGGTAIAVFAGALMEPLLVFFGATEQVMVYAVPYTRIIILGIPFLVFTTGACNLIRADGSPKYAMVCMLSGAIFNIIFDPVFLFVFDMGIAGIAWATTLGQILTAAIAAVYFLKRFHSVPLAARHLRLRLTHFISIISLGMASSLNQIAMMAVQIVLNNILRHYGALSIYGSEIPLACVGVVSKVNIVMMAFTVGISLGSQPIVGFNYGAKNYGRVRRAYGRAISAVTVTSALAFLCFQLFPRQIIGIFGAGSDLYFQFAVRYLRIYMSMTFLNGIQPVTSNFFSSIGKAKIGMILSLTRQILFLLPLLAAFSVLFGIDGVMFAGPVADGAAAVVSVLFAWREMGEMRTLEKALAGGAD